MTCTDGIFGTHKLTQYRALLVEGADAATVAGWMREVETERIGVQAKLRSVTGQQSMSPEKITAIVTTLGNLVKVLADADPADKTKIYEQLGLRLTYHLCANALDVEVKTPNGPGIETRSAEYVRNAGVRGASCTLHTRSRGPIWGIFSVGLPFAYLVDFTM